MPRGKYTSHKGKHRRFTNPEELEEQARREEKERQWREKKGGGSSADEEEEEEEKEKEKKPKATSSDSSSSEEDDDDEEGGSGKSKGVESLIDIENPNRSQKKTKKVASLDSDVKSELSRREREELERQRARANYQKLHAQGKTEEARADLARLAIIKKQREEAAKLREEEKRTREAAKQSKTEQVQKALGKKTT